MTRTAILILAATGCFIAPDRPTGGGGGGGGDGGPDVPPNIAFVTSTASDVAELNNPAVADALCTQLAQNAQPALAGTYKAWMSSADEPAQNRFGGARGWVRVDGRPFIDTIDDLVRERRIYYPLRIDENGNDVLQAVPTGPLVATATDKAGNRLYDCVNGATMTRGIADATGGSWTDDGTMLCTSSEPVRVYCLGVDRMSRVDPPPVMGPRVFITENPVSIEVNVGVSTFDTRCMSDAAAATPPLSGVFRAVVALGGVSANKRIGVGPPSWYRVDGVEVTSDFIDMKAPLNVTAKAHYLDAVSTWNGADDPTLAGSATCSDWAQPGGGSARIGAATRSNSDAFGRAGLLIGCSASNVHVYCAEVP
jgi:hypothetical protein